MAVAFIGTSLVQQVATVLSHHLRDHELRSDPREEENGEKRELPLALDGGTGR